MDKYGTTIPLVIGVLRVITKVVNEYLEKIKGKQWDWPDAENNVVGNCAYFARSVFR